MEEKSTIHKIGDVIGTIFGTLFLLLVVLWGIGEILSGSLTSSDQALTEREIAGTEQAEYDDYISDLEEGDRHSQDAYEDYQDDYEKWTNEQRGSYETSNYPSSIDCEDFTTQNEAQIYFQEQGGTSFDPYVLDGDGDGIACEWNP